MYHLSLPYSVWRWPNYTLVVLNIVVLVVNVASAAIIKWHFDMDESRQSHDSAMYHVLLEKFITPIVVMIS